MLKRLLAAVPILLLLPLAGTAACGSDAKRAGTTSCSYVRDGSDNATLPPSEAADTGKTSVDIRTSEGDVPITLDSSIAPCTVNSFKSLTEQHFFDNTPCHRLTTGAGLNVLQCGDPTGTGSGGPGYSFADETTGHDTYPAGTVAMANSGPDTNGSQFFLCYGDCSGLDSQPNYTVFGTISSAGMTVLKKIASAGSTPPGDGAPNDHVKIETVTD